ncbi:type IV secretory system conjugative DNA transfer family protein [Bradyrhizobium barranii subsp. apii]|uniref:Type IV secretory system conjugative DNA transfer family protein n=1 Tax=Bradyrhizobium barranii subsp. apii TaxID=2819348 RepID=A0A8T5V2N7_9BRAD|nr:type IV secretory system conjugative DNA transfer family protein [Bradyrhizobium barranii]UPT88234.1 type IV secretory system conjugative DNA transfer family protein [Bradyrhizobium barranii subsp. apii]
MTDPHRFVRIFLVLALIAAFFVLVYPAAFIAEHGWNSNAWPGNVPLSPSMWLRAWTIELGHHYIDFPLIFSTYRDMCLGQSDAFADGGFVEMVTLGTAAIFFGSLIILGGSMIPLRDSTNMYGSARWASKGERARLDEGLELGKDPESGRPIRVRVEGNLLTIAPPRTGKTNGFIIPNLLFSDPGAWAGPAVVIDPKGDAFRATRRRREAIGKTVRCIDPLGLADGGDRWNPLVNRDPKDVIYLQAMARALLASTSVENDDNSYFRDRAVDLIVASIAATIRNNRADPVSAAQLLLDQTAFLSAIEKRTDQSSVAARNILTMEEKGRASIVSTAEQATQWLRDERLQIAVQNHTFELSDLRSGEVDLFIVLPADERKQILAPYIRWLLSDLFASVRKQKPSERIIVFIDEAFVLGRYDAVLKGTGELPGYGISLWTFWQSRHQIIETYGAAGAETFIGTAEVVNLFNLSAAQPDEMEHWSKAIGTYTGVKTTTARDPKTGRINETRTPEAVRLVPPSDLPKFLHQWQVMLLTSRSYSPDPIKLRRTLAYNDARFDGLVDLVAPVAQN